MFYPEKLVNAIKTASICINMNDYAQICTYIYECLKCLRLRHMDKYLK